MDYTRMFSLEGKKALITGGATGLGYAIARGYVTLGVDVAIAES